MSADKDNWIRMIFKKNKVWVQSDEDGTLLVQDGKVRLKYRLDQDYEYRVYPSSVHSLDEPVIETSTESKPSPRKIKKAQPIEPPPDNAITLYTDGASSGNPGPAGIGVLFRYKEYEKEISTYIGVATNNIAELEAIRSGVLEIKKTNLPVRIYTDSAYAHGVLMLGWKAKKNTAIIKEIREHLSRFNDLKIIRVKGHAGLEGNERADKLATDAIKTADKKSP